MGQRIATSQNHVHDIMPERRGGQEPPKGGQEPPTRGTDPCETPTSHASNAGDDAVGEEEEEEEEEEERKREERKRKEDEETLSSSEPDMKSTSSWTLVSPM